MPVIFSKRDTFVFRLALEQQNLSNRFACALLCTVPPRAEKQAQVHADAGRSRQQPHSLPAHLLNLSAGVNTAHREIGLSFKCFDGYKL